MGRKAGERWLRREMVASRTDEHSMKCVIGEAGTKGSRVWHMLC